MKKAADKRAHPKREFRKELSAKLETVLAELKGLINEEISAQVKKSCQNTHAGVAWKRFFEGSKAS